MRLIESYIECLKIHNDSESISANLCAHISHRHFRKMHTNVIQSDVRCDPIHHYNMKFVQKTITLIIHKPMRTASAKRWPCYMLKNSGSSSSFEVLDGRPAKKSYMHKPTHEYARHRRRRRQRGLSCLRV